MIVIFAAVAEEPRKRTDQGHRPLAISLTDKSHKALATDGARVSRLAVPESAD